MQYLSKGDLTRIAIILELEAARLQFMNDRRVDESVEEFKELADKLRKEVRCQPSVISQRRIGK